MDLSDGRALRHAAAEALSAAPRDPRWVVLAYSGGTCLLSLLMAVISFVLSNQISNTGGLHNMGLRSVLSTGQTILPLVQMLVLLCWDMGYAVCALRMARRQETVPKDLLEGFPRFGPMLRAAILRGLIYFALGFATMYLSSILFMMLPVSQAFYEQMEQLFTGGALPASQLMLDDATVSALMQAMTPMLVIFLALFCACAIPIAYQYRMVTFCLADNPRLGALAAMRESRTMMRRKRFQLFRLDLGFWWFYLLQGLAVAVCYGDVLLPMAGVSLPWSSSVSYFLFYGLSLILQLALCYFALNRVHVTYAGAYDALRPKPQGNGVALGSIFDL